MVWLTKEEAEVMKKKVRDKELRLQAQIEATEIGNQKLFKRVSDKYEKVCALMNQQICLKRVMKRNEKTESKMLAKLKKMGQEADEQTKEIRIKIPFVFVRTHEYKPEKFTNKLFSWRI